MTLALHFCVIKSAGEVIMITMGDGSEVVNGSADVGFRNGSDYSRFDWRWNSRCVRESSSGVGKCFVARAT